MLGRLILLSVIGCAVSQGIPDARCVPPPDPRHPIRLPHPTDCSLWYLCQGSNKFLMPACPSTDGFDANLLICSPLPVQCLVASPTTVAPTTEAPTTAAPTTLAPVTTVDPGTTAAPTTEDPTTEAPTTEAPTTEAGTTLPPVTTVDPGLPSAPSTIPTVGRKLNCFSSKRALKFIYFVTAVIPTVGTSAAMQQI